MGIFNHKHPLNMVILINLAGFGLLSFFRQTFDKQFLFIGLALIFMFSVSYFAIRKISDQVPYIYLIVSMLASIGTIMIYRLEPFYGEKQVLWLFIGLCLFFMTYVLFYKIDYWDKLGFVYFAAAILLFILTMIIGKTINGSKNWIMIGGTSFQPSEIIKLLVILFLACRFADPDRFKIGKFAPWQVSTAMIYAVLGFLVLQREWGVSVLIFGIYLFVMYIFSEKWLVILINLGAAIFGAIGGFLFVSHIKVRVDVWLDPWADVVNKGYQITQSLFAIGAGGLFGTGIGLGSPENIPEVHNDFIFAAICEEFGILGGVAIIMLYFLMVYRGIRISMKLQNKFYKILTAGISIMLGLQAFIILGGVIKLIPLTGITLPFISYGGSSIVSSFIAIAILEAVADKPEKEVSLIE